MLTEHSVERFLAHMKRNGASPQTIRAYRTDLAQAMTYVDPEMDWEQTEDALTDYLYDNRERYSPKTIQRRLSTFRSWAKWAGKKDLLENYRAPKAAPTDPHPIPEGIDGVMRMIQSTRNPRHKALCTLTGLMGLRVAEAIAVRPEHFDHEHDLLVVRGKGDKVRHVPVTRTAWKFLKTAHKHASVSGTTLVRLSDRGARASVSRHAKRAGLSRHVSSHDMRATFATAAYEKGHDLRAVQELLGHSDSKTTQIYTRVSMNAKRAAAEVA